MSTVVDSYRFAAAGAPFNPETDITWHSLFWAEGTAFAALGYVDTNTVTSWPNETGESDASNNGAPTYDAVNANFSNRPVVAFGSGNDFSVGAWSAAPTYPISVVIIGRTGNTATNEMFFDGENSLRESRVGANSGDNWVIDQGTARVSSGGRNTTAHLLVAYFASDATTSLAVDGTSVISGTTSGTEQITNGAFIGADISGGNNLLGEMALVGIYEGNFTADGSYADFVTWAEGHYGLTIS